MIKGFYATLVCIFLMCSVFVGLNVSADGTETGSFPDRVFAVDNSKQWPVKDVSHVTTVTPDSTGYWWVVLTARTGTYVLVQVYDGSEMHTQPLSSSDLRKIGDESKKVFMSADRLYTVAFTCFGKKASAVLEERFESLVPFPCVPRDPIRISGNSEFTSANGVVSGDGSAGSPYVISGWSIAGQPGYEGIRVEWTSAHFIIRECYLHSALEESFGGLYLYRVSNGMVEDCVIRDNSLGIFAFYSSWLGISNNFFDGNGGACQFAECTDSFFVHNSVETEVEGLAVSYSQRVSVEANIFNAGGIYLFGLVEEHFRTNTITPDNLVAGRPVLFVKDASGVSIVGEDVAQVIVVSSTDVRVADMLMTGRMPLIMAYVDNGIVENCEFVSVTFSAMRLYACSNTVVRANWLHDCPGGWEGLVVAEESHEVTIESNVVERSNTGAILVQRGSSGAKILENQVSECSEGVGLFYASDSLVKENIIVSCGIGVFVGWSPRITVEANTVDGSRWDGIMVLDESPLTRVFHNSFTNNARQVYDTNAGGTSWDDGVCCGNYWSDYTGLDLNEDGIGDTPYVIDDINRDNYPLMAPWSGQIPGTPKPHAPIVIASNAEFTAENGVIAGSGLVDDPYVIAGWRIDASTSIGISVSGTTKYFVIRNVEIVNGGDAHVAVYLDHVSNAVIRDSSIDGFAQGVLSRTCTDLSLVDNSVTSVGIFAGVYWASDLQIVGNTISGYRPSGGLYDGVRIGDSSNVVLSHNSISDNVNCGAWIHSCQGVTVEYNTISNCWGGFQFGYDSDMVVRQNTIDIDDGMGIMVWGCERTSILANNVMGHGDTAYYQGMEVIASRDLTVSDNSVSGFRIGMGRSWGLTEPAMSQMVAFTSNTVTGCRYGFYLDHFEQTTLEGNQISANTFGVYVPATSAGVKVTHNNLIDNSIHAVDLVASVWDDGYPSGGNYWSGFVDVDADGDGIWDNGYVIDADSIDRYPFANPIG